MAAIVPHAQFPALLQACNVWADRTAIAYQKVPANRRGFRVCRNPRSFGRFARRSAVCESDSDRPRVFCAQNRLQVSASKIPFPAPRDGEAGAKASRWPRSPTADRAPRARRAPAWTTLFMRAAEGGSFAAPSDQVRQCPQFPAIPADSALE